MTLVMKFGGTSLGSAQRFKEVAHFVSRSLEKNEASMVVLSAMSGVTNDLAQSAQSAVDRDLDKSLALLKGLESKHRSLLEALFASPTSIKPTYTQMDALLKSDFEQLEILLKGICYLGELSKRSLDLITGFGELLSTKIFAQYMTNQGHAAIWLDARQFLITDDNFGRANPLWDLISERTQSQIMPLLSAGQCLITQGFIGSTATGIPTTLGRGGSDFSASIIGVAVGASEIQIWTDVDGMMSADPRLVPEAQVLSEVSFQEAAELAYFGAKVLHPSTIKPAIEKKIPVRILNTFKPASPGTLITDVNQSNASNNALNKDQKVCSIAAKKGITAIFVNTPNMLMVHGFLARVFAVFDKHQTQIDLVTTSEVSIALTIDRTDALVKIEKDLAQLGEVKVLSDVAIVTVVGKEFRHQSGIAAQIFRALRDINIIMIAGGASDINVSSVVQAGDADRAVKLLHDEFFPSVMPAAMAGTLVQAEQANIS